MPDFHRTEGKVDPHAKLLRAVTFLFCLVVASEIHLADIFFRVWRKDHTPGSEDTWLILHVPERVALSLSTPVALALPVVVMIVLVWHRFTAVSRLRANAVLLITMVFCFMLSWLMLFGIFYNEFISIAPLGNEGTFAIGPFCGIMFGFFPMGLLCLVYVISAVVQYCRATVVTPKNSNGNENERSEAEPGRETHE